MKVRSFPSFRRWLKKKSIECNAPFLLRIFVFLYLLFATLLIIHDHSDYLPNFNSIQREAKPIDSVNDGAEQAFPLDEERFDCQSFLQNNSFELPRNVNLLFRPISLNVNHFIALSTYRSGPKSFTVVGESSILERRRLGKPIDFCIWESFNEKFPPLQTEAKLHRAFNIHRKTFETVIIECPFLYEIGNDGQGGKLFLVQKKMNIKFCIHEEKPTEFCIVEQKPRFQTGLCGPPMFGHANPTAIKTWFLYHEKVVKFGHYFLYNYKVGLKFQKIINKYLKLGQATSIEISNWNDYASWYFHQSANNNDCLYRSRFYVKWIFYLDFDEFLYIPPAITLDYALREVENASYASLGSILWNVNFCLGTEQNLTPKTYIGRLIWRENHPTCAHVKYAKKMSNDLCLMDKGHRKFVANPLNVVVIGVHNPIVIMTNPLHWNSSIQSIWPKLYHFHGILGGSRVCRNVYHGKLDDSSMIVKNGYHLDVGFRDLIHKIGVE